MVENPAAAATKSVVRRAGGVNGKGKIRRSKVTVGDVTVTVVKPSSTELKRNVASSTSALERAIKRIVRPGVRIYPKKGVPLYSADPDQADVFIRKLDGKIERGILENGVFKVTS